LELVERLRNEGNGRPRVGFAWSSGKRNAVRDQSYLELEDLLEWIEDPSIEPVCLNYRVNDEDRALIASRPALGRFLNVEIDQWNDLYGTAALIDSCDIVVGAATSNTAIAGGLNKPVVLFMYNPARAAFAFATGTYPFYNWIPLVALKDREPQEVVADLRTRADQLLAGLSDPTIGGVLSD
jgi:ADP-heptose:LPS heptosyltransferase